MIAWIKCLVVGHNWMPDKFDRYRYSRCDRCGKRARYRYIDRFF